MHDDKVTRQRVFWREYLARYAGMHGLTTADPRRTHGKFAVRTVSTLLNHVALDELRRQVVVDFGCGTGRLARFVAPLCAKLICIDISQEMLDQARTYLSGHRNVEFRLTDGHDIGFGPAEVDFTYSYATLLYFNAESDFWSTVAMIDRVSRQFCLHLHAKVNETPNSAQSVERIQAGNIYDLEAYRPSDRTLRRHYPGREYRIEHHRPDVRGFDRFFYKAPRAHGGVLTSVRRAIRRRTLALSLASGVRS